MALFGFLSHLSSSVASLTLAYLSDDLVIMNVAGVVVLLVLTVRVLY